MSDTLDDLLGSLKTSKSVPSIQSANNDTDELGILLSGMKSKESPVVGLGPGSLGIDQTAPKPPSKTPVMTGPLFGAEPKPSPVLRVRDMSLGPGSLGLKSDSTALSSTVSNSSASAPTPVLPPPSTVGESFKFSPLRQTAAPTGNRVVVSVPDRLVSVYRSDGSVAAQYKAYIGTSQHPTPRGQFRIMDNIQPPASMGNRYGGHWMSYASGDPTGKGSGLYGFHGWNYRHSGTDEPNPQDVADWQAGHDSSWKTTTGGCVQLSNKDVAELSALVSAGDPVTVTDSPYSPQPSLFIPKIH